MTAARRASTRAAHGAAAATTAHPPVPRRPIIGSRPERQGRHAAPASPARLRPVLDPPTRSSGSAAIEGQGRPRPQAATPGPRASPACPQPQGTPAKDLVKPRLTRPRSFRDNTEEVTGSNPVRPTMPNPRSASMRPVRFVPSRRLPVACVPAACPIAPPCAVFGRPCIRPCSSPSTSLLRPSAIAAVGHRCRASRSMRPAGCYAPSGPSAHAARPLLSN
jgi:hypothetical protein